MNSERYVNPHYADKNMIDIGTYDFRAVIGSYPVNSPPRHALLSGAAQILTFFCIS
jgi:hypothetical protein